MRANLRRITSPTQHRLGATCRSLRYVIAWAATNPGTPYSSTSYFRPQNHYSRVEIPVPPPTLTSWPNPSFRFTQLPPHRFCPRERPPRAAPPEAPCRHRSAHSVPWWARSNARGSAAGPRAIRQPQAKSTRTHAASCGSESAGRLGHHLRRIVGMGISRVSILNL